MTFPYHLGSQTKVQSSSQSLVWQHIICHRLEMTFWCQLSDKDFRGTNQSLVQPKTIKAENKRSPHYMYVVCICAGFARMNLSISLLPLELKRSVA